MSPFAPRKYVLSRSERRRFAEVILPTFLGYRGFFRASRLDADFFLVVLRAADLPTEDFRVDFFCFEVADFFLVVFFVNFFRAAALAAFSLALAASRAALALALAASLAAFSSALAASAAAFSAAACSAAAFFASAAALAASRLAAPRFGN